MERAVNTSISSRALAGCRTAHIARRFVIAHTQMDRVPQLVELASHRFRH
jgi:hypothetical protein